MVKKIIFQLLKTLLNSFIAGLILGLCGAGFVLSGGEVFGSLFIGLGFIICLLYGYDVFVLKVPYVLENKGLNALETVISVVGNVIGTLIIALILRYTGLHELYKTAAGTIISQAHNFNYLEILVYSIFAGIIVYFGVNTYKKAEQPIARFLVLLLCGVLAYYVGNSIFSYNTFFYICSSQEGVRFAEVFGKLTATLCGNVLGGLIIPLLIKLRRKL